MKSPNHLLTTAILIILMTGTGCSKIFEHHADVQARQALYDLMEIQEQYYQENNKYARNLVQIEKYNLKYHTGIVYLEIESSSDKGYRAIALPAESTTARVFAYDTERGGFYEMDEEEVSRYVLGALNSIRDEQKKERLNDIFAIILFSLLVFFGIRFYFRFKSKDNTAAFTSYFLCLIPLAWGVSILNHMDPDIVVTSMMTTVTILGLGLAAGAMIWSGIWLGKRGLFQTEPSMVGLILCTILIALFSGGVLIHALVVYQAS